MNEETTTKKTNRFFQESLQKAKKLMDDPEKVKQLVTEASEKANSNQGALGDTWRELQLFFSLARDWVKGNYKKVPAKSIVAIIGAIIYFVSPIDALPDFLPVVGYLDDITVVGLVLKKVRDDLHVYNEWKNSEEQAKTDTETIPPV